MPRDTGSTVLLIEPDMSLRRLIALGLEHRGMQVIEVCSLTSLEDQLITDPDLLVLDIDNGYCDDASLLAAVQAHPYLSTLPMVVLAWDHAQFATRDSTLPLLEFLGKPFDARLLHATIENLLITSASIELSARRGIVPSSTASIVSSAGICPLLTAAGLLLTVVGLMLQLVVTGVGVLVMLVGLLWWTLGKRPARQVVLGEVNQKYSPSLP
jgi:DNA-binding NtrC family response regulator